MWAWVGYLGWCFCIYAAYLLGSTILHGSRPKHAVRWMKFIERLAHWRDRMKEKGRAHQAAIANLIAVMCIVLLASASVRYHYPEETQHNVRHIEHPSKYQWSWISDEHPEGFMLLACEDMEKVIYPGYFGKVIRWQWRENGGCGSFKNQGFEIDYDWKEDGKAKTDMEAGYGR